MSTKLPRTKQEFARYLSDTFDELQAIHGADEFEQIDIAAKVEEVSVIACRFGAGHLIDPPHQMMKPREALVVVGRLLAWTEKELRSPTLDVHEVAALLGCTERTVLAA